MLNSIHLGSPKIFVFLSSYLKILQRKKRYIRCVKITIFIYMHINCLSLCFRWLLMIFDQKSGCCDRRCSDFLPLCQRSVTEIIKLFSMSDRYLSPKLKNYHVTYLDSNFAIRLIYQ